MNEPPRDIFGWVVCGEVVLPVGDTFYVQSKTHPDHLYAIVRGQCGCDGFRYRQTCRHVKAVTQLAMLQGEAV